MDACIENNGYLLFTFDIYFGFIKLVNAIRLNCVLELPALAKSSVVVEERKSRIIVDKRTQSITINNLSINDQDVFEALIKQDEFERPVFIKKALKVGTIALRGVLIAEKVDYVNREFDTLSVELEKTFTKELGREGMKGELERIFGDKGELQACLEKLFGKDGKLARDLLDMDNNKSPIGQLRKTIESYFVGKDSEIYNMLDPNSKDSPISRLKAEILQRLEGIESDISTYLAKKEVVEKSPAKGFDFENDLEDFLMRLSKPFGDLVERTGTEKGKLGMKTGDFVIAIHDPAIKGQPPKIVIEAKTNMSVRLTPKSLVGELREALENREADFAIAVTQTLISEAVGCYRELEGDKIVCSFGDNGLPLEVAYRLARTHLLMKMHESHEHVVDIPRIYGIIGRIQNDLNSVRGIKSKLTSIGTTADAIADDMSELEQNIRDSLEEVEDAIHQAPFEDAEEKQKLKDI